MTNTDFDSLIDVDWLRAHADDPDLVILDCSVVLDPRSGGAGTSGRAEYDSGHIPGAAFADLTTDLRHTTSHLAYELPSPDGFAAAMESLGVGNDSTVVLYDRSSSFWAARVWWMLRWIGFDRAALLDGGLNAWIAAGYGLSTVEPHRTRGRLTPAVRPEVVADREEVLAATDDDTTCLVDTFTPEHYRGEWSRYDRPGHIPTAVNISAASMYDGNGRLLPRDELEALHPGNRDARMITYCGGGVMAAASAFVLHRLGFDDVAVYISSLREWAYDPSLPMETGQG